MTDPFPATVSAAYAGGFVTVMISGRPGSIRVPAGRNLSTAAVGDQVLLVGAGARLWATTLLGTAPPPPPPPPPDGTGSPERPPEEGGQTITGSEACPVAWSGSFRNGSWRPDTQDLYAGDWSGSGIQRGAVGYGRKPATLGTLLRGRTRIERLAGGVFGAQPLTMLLLAGGQTRPGSFPAVLATAPGPSLAVGKSADWAHPSGWMAQFQSGAAAAIGIGNGSASPYIHIRPPVTTFDWERTT